MNTIQQTQAIRAMVFALGAPVPMDRVEHCLYLALTYHRRKHLPMLGA
ncbi:MAG: hypothetical protein KAY82_03870 [Hylemonella sp.]|nr:hypothetical protein [Hylemonella sp.]